MCIARSRLPRSVRLPESTEESLAALVARSGMTYSGVIEAAVDRYLADQSVIGEANLIELLNEDFLAATFAFAGDGEVMSVVVTEVERRTKDPRGASHSPTKAPLTQFVRVEARPEPEGRATIELVGLPGTSEAGVRVFVATLPAQSGVRVTVRLTALHPLSRGAAEDEGVEAVSG